MRKWPISFLGILVLLEMLKFQGVTSFVKQLLKQPAKIDKNDLWSRSLPMVAIYGNLTLALTKSLKVPTPSYVQILTRGILSITSFSLLRKGSIMQFDLQDLSKSRILKGEYLWPNELTMFSDKNDRPILLVPDGFLLPGQNDGGLYAIRDPHTINALPIRITATKKGWFYHRAVHVKLPTGEEGILTARAKKPLFGRGIGELVWLSLPADLDGCFPDMPPPGDIVDLDLKLLKEIKPTRHTTMHKRAIEIATAPNVAPTRPIANTAPWVETILAEGPDVMFEVLDLDRSDDCLEVISAHFFGQKLSVHSIRAIPEAPFIEISAMKTLDTIGRPYGLCLATMTPTVGRPKEKEGASIQADYSSCDNSDPTHLLVSTHECSYDIPSAYNMALSALGGIYPSIITGAAFAFRNGQQSVRPGLEDADADVRGGSLFSYEIPRLVGRSNVTNEVSVRIDKSDVSRKDAIYNSENSYNSIKLPLQGLVSETIYSPVLEMKFDGRANSANALNAVGAVQLSTDVESTSLKWRRQTLFRGFKVCGWGGIFSPGAPGFPYVFKMPNKPQAPPLILLAGDCTGSAYVFAPRLTKAMKTNLENGKRYNDEQGEGCSGDVPNYELAFEIQCGATVGSAAVAAIPDGTGDVEIFVPSYEVNKVHIFRLTDND